MSGAAATARRRTLGRVPTSGARARDPARRRDEAQGAWGPDGSQPSQWGRGRRRAAVRGRTFQKGGCAARRHERAGGGGRGSRAEGGERAPESAE